MTNGTFQLQIDGNLAQKATEIFSRLGMSERKSDLCRLHEFAIL